MNKELDVAIRSALGDIVASTPRTARAPYMRAVTSSPSRWRGPVAVVTALTAAAGLIGIVVVSQDSITTSMSGATPPAPVVLDPVDGNGPLNATPPAVVPPGNVGATANPCGSTGAVPAAATDVQTITGDIDGDQQDDTVTLYALDGAWHVTATSSVKGWQSDTIVQVDEHDTMSINFSDIDYSAGASTKPPVAVMAVGQGANDNGVLGSVTLLSNTEDYCIAQWTFQGAPFQWVALQEPGHVTGLSCEGAAGSVYYGLLDSEQNADRSWHVVTRRLTHDFTTAVTEPLADLDVADSPDFANQNGNINGCGRDPLSAPTTVAPTTVAPTTVAPTTVAPPTVAPAAPTTTAAAPAGHAGSGATCNADTVVPSGATDTQPITGDIDGDVVADTVTLYRYDDAWWVFATSSVQHTASITPVMIDVDDTMTIAFSDIDYGLGYDTPRALAVIAIGQGQNDNGIMRNFTFLTNKTNFCISQWTYKGDPFEWVELQEPGHVTGMECSVTMGGIYFVLLDAVQQPDGTWRVVSRRLTHNFTTAKTETIDDQNVPDSPTITAYYGTLQPGCIGAVGT